MTTTLISTTACCLPPPFDWLDAHPDAALVLDDELRVVGANAALRSRLDWDELTSRLSRWLTREDPDRLAAGVLADRRARHAEWTLHHDVTFRLTLFAWAGRLVAQLQDVTSHVRVRRRLENLHDLTVRLASTADPDEAVQVILDVVLPLLGAERGAVFAFDRNGTRATLVGSTGYADELVELYREVKLSDFVPYGQEIHTGAVVRTTTCELQALLGLPPHPQIEEQPLALLPLTSEAGPSGVLTLVYDSDAPWGEDDVAFMRDVAARCVQALDRTRLMRRSQRERDRFDQLVRAVSKVVWRTGPNGEQIEGSRSWEAFTGQTAEASLDGGWLQMLHPDDREPTVRAWTAARQDATTYETRYRLRRSDGVYRIMDVRAVPVVRKGRVTEWVGMDVDVTDQVMAEHQLRVWGQELQKQVRERTEDLQRTLDELQAERDALSAFVAFTELTTRLRGRAALERGLTDILQRFLESLASVACYARDGDSWRLEHVSGQRHLHLDHDRIGPEFSVDLLDASLGDNGTLILSAEVVLATLPHERDPVVTAGLTPIRVSGRLEGVIVVERARPEGLRWTSRDESVLRAVGMALSLAAERVALEPSSPS